MQKHTYFLVGVIEGVCLLTIICLTITNLWIAFYFVFQFAQVANKIPAVPFYVVLAIAITTPFTIFLMESITYWHPRKSYWYQPTNKPILQIVLVRYRWIIYGLMLIAGLGVALWFPDWLGSVFAGQQLWIALFIEGLYLTSIGVVLTVTNICILRERYRLLAGK